MRVLKSIWLLGLMFSAQAYAASFDCGKARSSMEKTICGSLELSELDEELAKIYKKALQKEIDKKETILSQRKFISNIKEFCLKGNNAHDNVNCISKMYSDRIDELAIKFESKDYKVYTEEITPDIVGYCGTLLTLNKSIDNIYRKYNVDNDVAERKAMVDVAYNKCINDRKTAEVAELANNMIMKISDKLKFSTGKFPSLEVYNDNEIDYYIQNKIIGDDDGMRLGWLLSYLDGKNLQRFWHGVKLCKIDGFCINNKVKSKYDSIAGKKTMIIRFSNKSFCAGLYYLILERASTDSLHRAIHRLKVNIQELPVLTINEDIFHKSMMKNALNNEALRLGMTHSDAILGDSKTVFVRISNFMDGSLSYVKTGNEKQLSIGLGGGYDPVSILSPSAMSFAAHVTQFEGSPYGIDIGRDYSHDTCQFVEP